jgi:hypothetical protein
MHVQVQIILQHKLLVPLYSDVCIERALPGNYAPESTFTCMFFFFSNGLGITGSILVSVAVTVALVYACSGP